MDDLRKQALAKAASSSLLSSQPAPAIATSCMGPPPVPLHLPMQSKVPLLPSWTTYWDQNNTIAIPGRGLFNYYSSGKEGDPVVLFIHGGGYTGLTWSLVAKKLKDKNLRLISPDLRGHGLTKGEDDEDFSKETMSQDVAALWEHLVVKPHDQRMASSSSSGPSSDGGPCGILVGHSMGAALVVWASLGVSASHDPTTTPSTQQEGDGGQAPSHSTVSSSWATPSPASYPGRIARGSGSELGAKTVSLRGLGGLVMIDVVEGTAIAALPFMMGVISNRPSSFRSIQEAISWSGRTGQCKSKEAASISLPSQLVQSDIEVVVEKSGSSGGGSGAPRPPNLPCPAAAVGGGVTVMPSIGEDEEEQEEEEAARSKEGQEGDVKETVKESVWTWRTPLLLSQPHWTSWYRGLSDAFLSLTCPKMLMLAGSDRLDKELTIGQMQGKFQLSMMPNAGHAIQEDESGKVAEALVQFVQRFRIGLPPMAIPKAPFGTERVLPVAVGMPFKP